MGRLNMSSMQKKLDEESSNNYSNTEYDKLQQGKNVRRVLWPKGDRTDFYSEGLLHYSLGADGKRVVTCPRTFDEKNKCPVCEYVAELQKSKSKNDKKLAESIRAKRRIYINVINRDDEDETPKVLPIGVTILKGILETICDPDYGDITDPEDGRDITITRKGQGINTEYTVLPKPKASPVSDSQSEEEIEEAMSDLEALFVEKSYDEIQAILDGEEESDDEDSDDEDEEEDNDEYDDLDLDELEALCKKRKIKMPSKITKLKLITALVKWDDEHGDGEDEDSDDEDDADVEDDTEDEEETKPAKKSSKKSSSDDEDEDDDIMNEVTAALAKRNKKK